MTVTGTGRKVFPGPDSDWFPPESTLTRNSACEPRVLDPTSREPVQRRGLWSPTCSLDCPHRNSQTAPGWGTVLESRVQTRGL